MKKDFYAEIDKHIKIYEDNKPYHERSIHWICDRISWCWKWRKITEPQMNELCDRIMNVMEEYDGDIYSV